MSMLSSTRFLVRGSEDDVGNYSTCVEATVKGSLQTSQSLVISDYFLMFSGKSSVTTSSCSVVSHQ